MSNTKNIRNIFLAVAALVLTGAIFTGCGRNEKTGNECGKTEVFADDLQKGNAAYDEGEYDAATEFFRIAAQEGNSEALFCLGRAYYFGMGVEQNFQEAVKWFRLAADQGNPQGQFHLRQYYPDFLAKMADGSYQLIEVKGDNMIDDAVVNAKKAAAEEMALASGVEYLMYAGSEVCNSHILEDKPSKQTAFNI